MHELIAFAKVVSLALIMLIILIALTLALLSILNDDMVFGDGVIELKEGKLVNILMKLAFCGVVMIGYVIFMVVIR
jgi:hypothetical protein